MGYNDTPSDELFNELKQAAIEIWKTYDDEFGYATEKIDQVNSLSNFKDNWGTFVGMFDIHNQRKLYDAVSPEAQALVDEWVGGSLEAAEQRAKDMGLI
jgi:hypothetical protein